MKWQDRLASKEELQPFLNGQNAESLRNLVEALLAHQRANWQSLHEGYEALSQVETKRLNFDDSSVVVQHNPKRIRSTAAAVDKASVQARRCFLCPDNLPAEEKGIAYGAELVILCNPFPVLDKHLVIAHREHIDQKLEGHIDAMLSLARDLGDDYFVLYNGAACGASAPDHFHLQALSRASLPIIDTLNANEPPVEPTKEDCNVCADVARGQFELFTVGDAGRSVIVLRGASRIELSSWLEQVIESLGRATRTQHIHASVSIEPPETMMNIVCYADRGVWTVLVFPRSRHRPACFFAAEPDRLLVSPGAVDMAGVLVVPEHSHFVKIDIADVEAIFTEVSLSLDFVEGVLEQLCGE